MRPACARIHIVLPWLSSLDRYISHIWPKKTRASGDNGEPVPLVTGSSYWLDWKVCYWLTFSFPFETSLSVPTWSSVKFFRFAFAIQDFVLTCFYVGSKEWDSVKHILCSVNIIWPKKPSTIQKFSSSEPLITLNTIFVTNFTGVFALSPESSTSTTWPDFPKLNNFLLISVHGRHIASHDRRFVQLQGLGSRVRLVTPACDFAGGNSARPLHNACDVHVHTVTLSSKQITQKITKVSTSPK